MLDSNHQTNVKPTFPSGVQQDVVGAGDVVTYESTQAPLRSCAEFQAQSGL